MSMEILMQYVTYMLGAIGVLAFFVSLITQVIKEMPWLRKIQTNAVALSVAFILCPLAVVFICQYFKIVITWYYVFASFLAAFIVYLVSTGGWEKVAEMWNRAKYDKR
ncbi:ribonuclease [Lachnospiraceae bacterium 50-23]